MKTHDQLWGTSKTEYNKYLKKVNKLGKGAGHNFGIWANPNMMAHVKKMMNYKKYSKPNVFTYFGTIVEEPNYMKFIQRPASIWPGDSGGGVFAKFQNKNYVVGIISNYIVIQTFGGTMVVSECSATIIVNYLDWIKTEIENEMEQVNKIVKDGR